MCDTEKNNTEALKKLLHDEMESYIFFGITKDGEAISLTYVGDLEHDYSKVQTMLKTLVLHEKEFSFFLTLLEYLNVNINYNKERINNLKSNLNLSECLKNVN